jgi:hypothetical protein
LEQQYNKGLSHNGFFKNIIRILKAMRVTTILVLFMLVVSCSQEMKKEVENPFPENSMFPNVFESDGKVYISYIHSIGDTLDELYFSVLENGVFSNPKKIAEGEDWFVNWADVPAIAAKGDHMIASWLDKSADGVYDYDVKMSISNDEGENWSTPFIPHRDSINAEHGFVSMTEDFQTVWLDGRDTLNKQMTLRSAIISPSGELSAEHQIDERVCDCCQTAIEKTSIGTFVLYRNRSADEVRDHFFSIYDGASWSKPKAIFNDNWKISGCPVNGPVIDAIGKNISAAWYTEANGKAEIYLAHYDAEKNSFARPILVSNEKVLGRLDLLYLDDDRILISWMDTDGNILGKILDENSEESKPFTLATTSPQRSSGFPKLWKNDDGVFLIYNRINPHRLIVIKLEV